MNFEIKQASSIHPLKSKAQIRRAMIATRQKNSVFWQLIHLLGSMQLALLLLATIGIACGVATFTESHFDSKVAHALIYKAPWFLAWLTLLCINLFAVTLTRWPWEKKHLGFVITHYGIITLLIGAAIGSKYGFEGNVTLQIKGKPVQKITTSQSVLELESPLTQNLYLLPFDATLVRPSIKHPKILDIPETPLQLVINNWSEHLEQQPKLIADQEKGAPALLMRLTSQALHQEQLVALSLGENKNASFDFFGLAKIKLIRKLKTPNSQPSPHESQLVMSHFAPVIAGTPSGIKIQLNENGEEITFITPDQVSTTYARQEIMRHPISLGQFQIIVQEYWPDLKLVEGKPTTASPLPNNPAIRVEISTEEITQNTLPPIISVAHNKTTEPPLLKPAAHKPWLELALEEKNDLVNYQLGRHDKISKKGTLKAGETISLGWADWQMELLQAGPHEVITYTTVPKDASTSKNTGGIPGFHAFLQDQTGLKGDALWLPSGEVTPLTIDSATIRIGYGLEMRTIPFTIELLNFEIPRDEGTETPGDFRATVRFQNLKTEKIQDASIRMNHPASFPGGILANITGFNYKFSQAEWNPRNLQETTLQVLYDPGWLLKWLGSLGICIGIALMFYWKEKRK